jgi:hypothetical protein
MNDPSARRAIDLLRGLIGPAGPELTCEECFEHLNSYVELELSNRDPDATIPGMRAHLTGCPACAEDHGSLYAFVGSGQHAPR